MKMIFFDLDGTLLDHEKAKVLGIKGFYKEYSAYLPYTEDIFHNEWRKITDKHFGRYLKGEISYAQQRIERIKEIFTPIGQNLSDDEAEERFGKYLKIYEETWIAFDDVVPCLNELKNYRLGILSNGDEEHQLKKLKYMGIVDYFEDVVTAGATGFAKPDLRIFEIACKRAKLSTADCCYVGDDLMKDVVPCKQIGMKGIWLNRKNEFCEITNIEMISSLKDLKQQLIR